MLLLILLLLAKQRPTPLRPTTVLFSALSTAAMPLLTMLVATGTASVTADEPESYRQSIVDRRGDPPGRLAGEPVPERVGPLQGGPLQTSPTIREGTQIPPTIGKFVIVGRRWSFVPEPAPPLNGQRGHATEIPSTGTAMNFPVLVVENLLLQRVVEAVRDDTIADRWSVTGRLTEFFGENRLILQTARRADGR